MRGPSSLPVVRKLHCPGRSSSANLYVLCETKNRTKHPLLRTVVGKAKSKYKPYRYYIRSVETYDKGIVSVVGAENNSSASTIPTIPTTQATTPNYASISPETGKKHNPLKTNTPTMQKTTPSFL